MIAGHPLTEEQFNLFRRLIFERVGIHIKATKQSMVKARLNRLIGEYGCENYAELYRRLKNGDTELLQELADAITTNVTSFFREKPQWLFLREHAIPELETSAARPLRIWSAGCSGGEEPYSIAITLLESLDKQHRDFRILATDISNKILKRALEGSYHATLLAEIPRPVLLRHFQQTDSDHYRIAEHVREKVIFRSFNLVHGDYTLFEKPFDIIFCRNVLIYFDSATQQRIIEQFHALLTKGGYLFLGHSESLNRYPKQFGLVAPSVYQTK